MDELAHLPFLKITPIPNLQSEAGYFGYVLPYLPDFLTDHTLLGENLETRLAETLERFERLIIGLRKYQQSAYTLRFFAHPHQGRIDVAILGRVMYPHGRRGTLENAADDLGKHLTAYGFPYLPLREALEKPGDLFIEHALQPFDNPALVEIRQHGRVEELLKLNPYSDGERNEAYVIHPYWRVQGACLEPFEVMLRQPSPTVLSIYLEPTDLTPGENSALTLAAQIAQTLSNIRRERHSEVGIQDWRDPTAELIGRIYSAYHKSLRDPFLVLVQAASPNPNAAWTVARAYASAIIPKNVDLGNDERVLPSNTDLIPARTAEEIAQARQTFERLFFSAWNNQLAAASLHKERLPYLAGARGASAVFRFPVSVRGGVPGIAVRQRPPDFEPGPRPNKAGLDEIHLGDYRRGGAAVVPLQALTRHSLITGFTGSGKTNTVLYLLDQLWKRHRIPFLVVESAKKEYRSLLNVPGFEDLLVFTLGDETVSPFRLNPFELLPGVRVEAHLGRLQACFDAALPQFGILPSIVAEAMEEIYKAKRWRLTDRAPLSRGSNSGADRDQETGDAVKFFPTLREMFDMVIKVTDQRGYEGETRSNIRAASAGRIGNLLRGSRGRMFSVQRSFPAEIIFHRPVILELNDLNEDDKALTMMFLLIWLREYRELHAQKILQHVTVVEEAHNVLSNVQSVGNQEVAADTKAKAVAAFSNMLAEVRAYGEGLIISDQSPEKLAPDAMRNTNLQIAHQLRDRHDREAIARAMIMEEEQQSYLGKLRVGEAAFFATGLEKATFIQIPEYKDTAGFDWPPNDAAVRKKMERFQQEHFTASLPFHGCRFCGSLCNYREVIEPYTLDQEKHEQFIRALKRFDVQPEREHWPAHWREIAGVCREIARQAGTPNQVDAAYCYLAHEIEFPFTEHMRRSFESAFREVF